MEKFKKKIRRYLKSNFPLLYYFISVPHQKLRWFFIWRKAGLSLKDELAAYRSLNQARKYKTMPRIDGVNKKASLYVGTEPKEGLAQLAILIHYGCRSSHKVLEIGCGALQAGYPIMQYLNKGSYFGIEPNKWLVNDSLKIPEVSEMTKEKETQFAYNDQFDTSCFNTKFDYVISHSILSHAAHWQWPIFMDNMDKCLKKGSKIFASLYFTEGNKYGAEGYNGTESDFNSWVYPGISYFRQETIKNLAEKFDYNFRVDLVCPMLITKAHPSATHSWIILEKK